MHPSTSAGGGAVGLSTCDREPISTPGSRQNRGLLLIGERATLGVNQGGAGSARWSGAASEALLGRPPGGLPPASQRALADETGPGDGA